MSIKLDGKKLSLKIEERLTEYISSNKTIAKRAPGLAVIRIGEDPASGVYVNNKEKACSRIGIKSFIFHLKDSVEQKEVEQLISNLILIKILMECYYNFPSQRSLTSKNWSAILIQAKM